MKAFATQCFTHALLIASAVTASGALANEGRDRDQLDIYNEAEASTQFETFTAALEAAELSHVLRGEGPYTVFMPTDEAFSKMPKSVFVMLLEPHNRERLVELLEHHMVAGEVGALQALNAGEAQPLSNETLVIDTHDNALRIDEVEVIASDLEASNGVIHVIDEVLLPESFKRQLSVVPEPRTAEAPGQSVLRNGVADL